MLRSQYTILAEYVREGTNNKLDLLGIFDRVFANEVPAQHAQLAFVAHLVGENEDDVGKQAMKFSFTTPSGKVLLEHNAQVNIKIGQDGTWFASGRFVFRIEGLPLPEWGRYRFMLNIAGREVASHVLSVAPAPK